MKMLPIIRWDRAYRRLPDRSEMRAAAVYLILMGKGPIRICTIGFTRKSAEEFFGLIREARIGRLIDIRLHNTSQMAGFAKRSDLEFFVHALCRAEYLHRPDLAPTPALFDFRKKDGGDWNEYSRRFRALLAQRRIQDRLSPGLLDGSCLLCSEASPRECHRRLVAEYLQRHWRGAHDVRIEHLE